MSKKKYNSSQGVWRTIGGRRVFIKTGQSLSDAMKDSGKFKTKMNEEAVKGAREEDLKEQYKDSLNNVSKMEYNGEITKEEYDKAVKNINKTYIDKRNEYAGIKKEDKFYTRKDGTKEYDPYKGTRFEKKYDNVDEAIKDPNSALNKYISEKKAKDELKVKRYPDEPNNHEYISVKRNLDENLKVPRASGAKDFSEYGIDIREQDTKERFSDYLRDKYGTDDFRIISYDDKQKAQEIYHNWNKEQIKMYEEKWLDNEEYLRANRPNSYYEKLIDTANNNLKQKYSGTVDYLQKTTNMSDVEILKLLKKIDEDKK